MRKKIGIVTSEGGARCAYAAGAILALVEKYDLTEPYLVMGSSGSTGTLFYYISGQYQAIKNIWENLLSTRKFVSFFRFWRIMDIDYLIDHVLKKENKVSEDEIKFSPIKYDLADTNKRTGEFRYFHNGDDVDIFEALRASSAMPVAYNKSVLIEGAEYIDGSLSADLQQNILSAQSKGAEKIIAIDNADDSWWSIDLLELYANFFDKAVKKKVEEGIALKHKKYGDSVFLIKPEKLKIGTLDNRQSRLKQALAQGYEDTANNPHLMDFLAS